MLRQGLCAFDRVVPRAPELGEGGREPQTTVRPSFSPRARVARTPTRFASGERHKGRLDLARPSACSAALEGQLAGPGPRRGRALLGLHDHRGDHDRGGDQAGGDQKGQVVAAG